jgi:hypothetical protein
VFAPPLPASSFLQLLDAMEPVGEAAPGLTEADGVSAKVADRRSRRGFVKRT